MRWRPSQRRAQSRRHRPEAGAWAKAPGSGHGGERPWAQRLRPRPGCLLARRAHGGDPTLLCGCCRAATRPGGSSGCPQ
eukprot:6353607-Alexandrium_andersonii.AAC.1